jgi:histone deacetylase complex regulatory component SIN3
MTYVMIVKDQFATDSEKYNKYLKFLKLYEVWQLGLPELLQNVSELFTGHPDLWE